MIKFLVASWNQMSIVWQWHILINVKKCINISLQIDQIWKQNYLKLWNDYITSYSIYHINMKKKKWHRNKMKWSLTMLPKTKLERTSDFDASKREKKGKIWFEYTPNPFVNKSLQHIKPILSPLKLFLDDDEDIIYTKYKILLSLNYVLIK